MKKRDMARHELIGLKTEVIDSKNKSNVGIRGTIIDETKFTLVIDRHGPKRLFKGNVKLRFGDSIIDGKSLIGRPKDRIRWRN